MGVRHHVVNVRFRDSHPARRDVDGRSRYLGVREKPPGATAFFGGHV